MNTNRIIPIQSYRNRRRYRRYLLSLSTVNFIIDSAQDDRKKSNTNTGRPRLPD